MISSGDSDRTSSGDSFDRLLDNFAEIYGHVENSDFNGSYEGVELKKLHAIYRHAITCNQDDPVVRGFVHLLVGDV